MKLYKIVRPIIKLFMIIFYRIEVIGSENIPLDKSCVLAGNHKNNMDAFFLMSSTKRVVRFLGKKELLNGKFGFIFKHMGVIPIDRQNKNKESVDISKSVLKNNGVVGIFPEGTFNRTKYIIKPFKIGAVKMANDTNSYVVPFAIKNDYKLFRKSVKLIIDKPYKVSYKDDLIKENNKLMNKVIKLLKEDL